MRTIAECARLLREDDPGTAITQNALRSMVLRGEIPCVRVGSKRLINYDLLVQLLESPPTQEPAPAEQGTIRRVG